MHVSEEAQIYLICKHANECLALTVNGAHKLYRKRSHFPKLLAKDKSANSDSDEENSIEYRVLEFTS